MWLLEGGASAACGCWGEKFSARGVSLERQGRGGQRWVEWWAGLICWKELKKFISWCGVLWQQSLHGTLSTRRFPRRWGYCLKVCFISINSHSRCLMSKRSRRLVRLGTPMKLQWVVLFIRRFLPLVKRRGWRLLRCGGYAVLTIPEWSCTRHCGVIYSLEWFLCTH